MRVELEKAYVLHCRKYTDSKILVDLLTENYGFVSCVFRMLKKTGQTRPQQFTLSLVSWNGKTELKTLTKVETTEHHSGSLMGNTLYCGLYVNELLERLLERGDPHPEIFYTYGQTISKMQSNDDMEGVLRNFELDLLQTLGYGLDFSTDIEGSKILEDIGSNYLYIADKGFSLLFSATEQSSGEVFSGDVISAIANREFSENAVRLAAKKICRLALKPFLGNKPLKSRELFR